MKISLRNGDPLVLKYENEYGYISEIDCTPVCQRVPAGIGSESSVFSRGLESASGLERSAILAMLSGWRVDALQTLPD